MKKLRTIPIMLVVVFGISQGRVVAMTDSNFAATAQATIIVTGLTIDTTDMPADMAQIIQEIASEHNRAIADLQSISKACDRFTEFKCHLSKFNLRMVSLKYALAELCNSLDYIAANYPFIALISSVIPDSDEVRSKETAIRAFQGCSGIIQDIGNAVRAITDQTGKTTMLTETEMQPLVKLGIEEKDIVQMFDNIRKPTGGDALI